MRHAASVSRFAYTFQDLLFCKLTPAKIVRLFTHIVMEKRIVFFADQYSTLHVIAESMCALLYPFYWQVWAARLYGCCQRTFAIRLARTPTARHTRSTSTYRYCQRRCWPSSKPQCLLLSASIGISSRLADCRVMVTMWRFQSEGLAARILLVVC